MPNPRRASASGHAHRVAIRTVVGKFRVSPHRDGVALRLIEPGKPNQNAYVESFNGRLHDECSNEYGFTSLAHARPVCKAVGHQGRYNAQHACDQLTTIL